MKPFHRALIGLSLLATASGPSKAWAVPPAPTPAASSWGETFRDLTLEQALQAASSEGKLALFVFFSSNCQPCQAYDGFTFADPAATGWIAEHVVAVRRVEDEAGARRFDVNRYPALVFATPEGQEIDRIDVFLEPGPFVAAAVEILERRSLVATAQAAVDQAPDDPRARLELARALLKRQRWHGALAPLQWVFDRTRGDPVWVEERLGFVLERLAFLRRNDPQAEAWLRARREGAATSLRAVPAEPLPASELLQSARDLVALDHALGEIRQTLALWDELRGRSDLSPAVLAELFTPTTEVLLLEDKRYADLLAGVGDVLVDLERDLGELRALDSAGPDRSGRRPAERQRKAALEKAARYYQALLGVAREDDAAALVELLLGLEGGAKSYQALIGAAVAVERRDLARTLSERGLSALPEGPERQGLQRYSQRILQQKGG